MALISKKASTAADLASSADNLLKVFKNTVSGLSGVISKAREQALEEVANKNEQTLNKLTDLLG